MKITISLKKLSALLVALTVPFVAVNASFGAVTFTNTPTAVSNTYSGTITLQVTGLTNAGDTVVVQKFLDLNANGAVDAGDLMVQQFNLTDGQAGMVIGGVTNFNVPGDTDGSANGQITAKLNIPNGDFSQNIIGQYLFVLSSPAGHFTAITNSFAITNFPFAQKITGIVSNATAPLPDAPVFLFPAPRSGNHGPGTPVAAAVANNSGVYTIQVPPGTYVPMAFAANYVADYSASPVLTLGSGQTITTNLTLTTATAIISGTIVDAVNTNIGLPGIFLPASANSLIAIAFSDTNGDFTVQVSSGQWGIGSDDGGLIVHGYVGYQNGTNVAAGTTNSLGTFYKATSLFYGSVKDTNNNPLVGIDINDQDETNGIFEQDGFTDVNGNYVVGAVGGLGSGDPWQVQVSEEGGNNYLTNYIFSQPQFQQNGNGTNLATNIAVLANFTAILATNHITGNVKFNGTNVSGVNVSAFATIGGMDYNSDGVDTDSNGNYSFNVANGNWSVSVNESSGDDSLDHILGSGNYQPPDNQNVNINSNNGVANFTVQPCGGIQVFTTNLPDGQLGGYYNVQLQASSCAENFVWSLGSGTLPPGLTLYQSGPINGTPTNSGTFNFTVHVIDNGGSGVSTNQSFSLFIHGKPAISLPQKTSSSKFQFLFSGVTNQNYTVQYSTNLMNWAQLFITNSAFTNSFMVIDPNATNNREFYRILIEP